MIALFSNQLCISRICSCSDASKDSQPHRTVWLVLHAGCSHTHCYSHLSPGSKPENLQVELQQILMAAKGPAVPCGVLVSCSTTRTPVRTVLAGTCCRLHTTVQQYRGGICSTLFGKILYCTGQLYFRKIPSRTTRLLQE
jgi:hypothetical protein